MKTTVILIDVSNQGVSNLVRDRIYRTENKLFHGVAGLEIQDWQQRRDQRRLVIAKVNSASVAAAWKSIELPPIPKGLGRKSSDKMVQAVSRQVRDSLDQLKSTKGSSGTQVIFGLSRLCSQGLAGPDTTVFVVSDGIEQSELLNMYPLNSKGAIYSTREHGSIEAKMLSGIKRAGVDLRGANVVFWLTGNETGVGKLNQVIGTLWGNVLRKAGARSFSVQPLNSVSE